MERGRRVDRVRHLPPMTRPPTALALRAAVVAVVVAAVGSVSVDRAAFTDATSNAGSSAAAAASFAALRVASGSYVGDGVDGRSVAVGFQPDVVIVKAVTADEAVIRTSAMVGDATKPAGNGGTPAANLVESLGATGFTVGTDVRVNASATTYHWTAWKAAPGELVVGSYVGIGGSQTISGLGLAPIAVLVGADANDEWNIRMSGMTAAYQLDNEGGNTNRITSLDVDGFSVGSSAQANGNGKTYFYVAVGAVPGTSAVLGWVGDGSSPRSVLGAGFTPGVAIVRADANRRVNWRTSAMSGLMSLPMDADTSLADALLGLVSDGVTVGSGQDVNANTEDIAALVLRQTG